MPSISSSSLQLVSGVSVGRLGSGCPVTGSLVLRGSIGPALTLRLPFPGMVCLCVV